VQIINIVHRNRRLVKQAIMKIEENSNNHWYDIYFEWFLQAAEGSESSQAISGETLIANQNVMKFKQRRNFEKTALLPFCGQIINPTIPVLIILPG
jgi:hypothetical protein